MTHYIYLVRAGGLLTDAAPVAGFTDVGELREWLRARDPNSRRRLKLFRMQDGGRGAVIELSIHDIINEEG